MPEGVAAGIHNNLETLRGRQGVSILELWELFPDDDHAEAQHPPTRHDRPDEIRHPAHAAQTPHIQRPHSLIAQKQAKLQLRPKAQPAADATGLLLLSGRPLPAELLL